MSSTSQERAAGDRRLACGSEVDQWILRLDAGPLSPEEARAFNAWLLENPEHEKAFEAGKEAYLRMDYARNDPRLEEWVRPSFRERVFEVVDDLRRGDWRLPGPRIAVPALGATALAAAMVAVFLVLPGTDSPVAPGAPAAETIVAIEPDFVTETAEIREEILPDGSIVTLGAKSAIDVQFTEGVRRVVLTAGEAFFDVEKNPDRPFIVVADGTLVRVLGTKFDVSLGTDLVDVAVSEGRVEVIRPEGDMETITDRDVKHVLTAGQRVTAVKTGRVRPVETVDVEKVAAWRRGELIWLNTPVKDIIADLNRYSETRITLGNDAYGDIEYTFAFQAEETANAVDIIADSLGAEVIQHANGDLILR